MPRVPDSHQKQASSAQGEEACSLPGRAILVGSPAHPPSPKAARSRWSSDGDPVPACSDPLSASKSIRQFPTQPAGFRKTREQ